MGVVFLTSSLGGASKVNMQVKTQAAHFLLISSQTTENTNSLRNNTELHIICNTDKTQHARLVS